MGSSSPALKWSSNFPGTDNTVTLGQGREGVGELFPAREDR